MARWMSSATSAYQSGRSRADALSIALEAMALAFEDE